MLTFTICVPSQWSIVPSSPTIQTSSGLLPCTASRFAVVWLGTDTKRLPSKRSTVPSPPTTQTSSASVPQTARRPLALGTVIGAGSLASGLPASSSVGAVSSSPQATAMSATTMSHRLTRVPRRGLAARSIAVCCLTSMDGLRRSGPTVGRSSQQCDCPDEGARSPHGAAQL
jgi:hypothetical protein